MRTCPTRPTASRDDSVEFQFNSRHQWIQAFKSVHTASAHMTLYPSYVIDGDKQQTRNIAFVALVFTARRYAKRGICRRRVSVCLCVYVCVCVSVTLRYCIKTAKRRITQITPHDSSFTPVFWHQSSLRNSKGVTPYGGDKCRWDGIKFVTLDKKRAITRKRYKIDI